MAVYGAAFTLKFMSKLRKKNPIDYPVMALEGRWWVKGGKHHEIYLGDPRRAKPEKLKTVLRYGVRRRA